MISVLACIARGSLITAPVILASIFLVLSPEVDSVLTITENSVFLMFLLASATLLRACSGVTLLQAERVIVSNAIVIIKIYFFIDFMISPFSIK